MFIVAFLSLYGTFIMPYQWRSMSSFDAMHSIEASVWWIDDTLQVFIACRHLVDYNRMGLFVVTSISLAILIELRWCFWGLHVNWDTDNWDILTTGTLTSETLG